MNPYHRVGVLVALLILTFGYSVSGFAQSKANAVLTPAAALKWVGAGIPGVEIAVVQGNMAKGPSHFYLKYPAGFVSPRHHHSPDHYVATVTGNLVLVAEGKEQPLAPGSYFAFTGKAQHVARCEGTQDCVMFIDARGAWDVVPAKPSAGK
jgi:quercetin dioxygenase-like cupin family protein